MATDNPEVGHGEVVATPPSPRLIVVDDEPEILALFGELFEDGPWTLVPCPDVATARAAMDDGVDVLLTDKNLPDGSGLDLLAEARARTEDAEVLLFTGYASLDTAIEALQLGAFDYIVKPPPSVFDVRRKVEQAFARQRMVRENRRLLAALEVRNAALAEAVDDLQRTRDELVQAEKLAGIGTLAAGIAHEIGSPLFGVMGLAEAILDEEDLGEIHSHAREIVTYSRTIKEIVVGLGSYTRRADPERQPVALRAAIVDAVRLVTRSSRAPEAAIVVDVPDEAAIEGRPTEVQQIVVNLVRNALEAVVGPQGSVASAPEGSVRVSVVVDDDEVVLAVSDRGPGIPEAQQRDVFDPFFTTKEPGRGTGLGLNIVYRLVTRHRGTIRLDSAQGQGTTFTIRFPRDPDAA